MVKERVPKRGRETGEEENVRTIIRIIVVTNTMSMTIVTIVTSISMSSICFSCSAVQPDDCHTDDDVDGDDDDDDDEDARAGC